MKTKTKAILKLEEVQTLFNNRMELRNQEFTNYEITAQKYDTLAANGNRNEALRIHHKMVSLRESVQDLDCEIQEIKDNLQDAQFVVDHENLIHNLVELGKRARESRDAYEKKWAEIHSYLKEHAWELAQSYLDWQENSLEFNNTLYKISHIFHAADISLFTPKIFEDAKSLAADLKSKGVDFDTLYSWPNIAIDGIFIQHKELSPMDGEFLGAMDMIIEGGVFGRELDPSERRKYSVRHSLGHLTKFFHGTQLTWPFFSKKASEDFNLVFAQTAPVSIS